MFTSPGFRSPEFERISKLLERGAICFSVKQKFLKYLDVKSIATIRKIISRQLTLLKNGGKTLKFRRFKNKMKIQLGSQSTKKIDLALCLDQLENKNFETNLLGHEAKQLDVNKQTALHDCISQVFG